MTDYKLSQIGPPRFALAVHALFLLAKSNTLQSSSSIAQQVNSHATFLRRVLALLCVSGIVKAKEGRDGGYGLLIPASKLTLADIYMAVRPECLICSKEEPECDDTGKRLAQLLEEILSDAEQETVKYLRTITLDEIMDKIKISC
ncbi:MULTISPECIES: RrF2 family transcriptional regulator [Bacillaceae]|uniref:Rrf2 family protein n=1 Tax=Peribacillus huizhouensis TaxID=1501239 RepID=A0ABR6CMI5_9BACI|nr:MULTISPECIES: Rrf2 family transcriptional regulator [Bacillaceae]MBA9026228.1 Rrf2 family protein [Peribacillus huizhouensis]